MAARPENAMARKPLTDGAIAAINLESARLQSWSRFWRAPERSALAELILEQELLTMQFRSDFGALDRLDRLASAVARADPGAAPAAIVAAQVACAAHRFEEARAALGEAQARGAPSDAVERLSLTLDQATGESLDCVLAARRRRAAQPGCWSELVPLGAVLADLCEFDEAERTYQHALRDYQDVSPFALAWVCFELGMLWSERVPVPRAEVAAQWYRAAIDILPCYVKARVHLAEILLSDGQNKDAEDLLRPALESVDPEVAWRLAEAAGNAVEATTFAAAARAGFESLLARHPLAFADHGTEFYMAGGGEPARAFALARLNLANRPTLRAFEQAVDAALAAGEPLAAAELATKARQRWAGGAAFRNSSMAIWADDFQIGTNEVPRGSAHART